MKKKILIAISVMLLLAVGAFCAFLIYDAPDMKEESTDEVIDIAVQIKENEKNAFSFLEKSENTLPEDMRGYIVDFEKDIDFSDTSDAALKNEADAVFEKVDAIKPNTVVIKYSSEINYSPAGFDVLKYFTDSAKNLEMYVVLLPDGGFSFADKEEILEKTGIYNIDAVMLDASSGKNEKAAELREYLAGKDIKLGVYCADSPDENEKKLLAVCDFCFVQINNSTENGAENIIKQWSKIGLENNSYIYGVIRNDLVKSGTGWTLSNEVTACLKHLYNHGGFSGCVMYSHEKLQNNDNDTATNLYSYYEYFNNVDYTALTYTDVSISADNSQIVFSGTTDKNYPLHIWCTANGNWQTVSAEGEEGSFKVSVPLAFGENKVTVKHKNARYTYYIDRAVDVLKEQSAVIENGKAVLTVKAYKGAAVFASLANTVAVELKATGEEANGYAVYSAEYELKGWLEPLTAEQISFAATYGGMNDAVMCSAEKEITPYDDHGLGTANICRVEKDYTETTSTASLDDTSDPTCTPQLSGSYGYVEKVTQCDNNVLLYLTSGMKLHCDDTRLILGGFVMPDNSIKLEKVNHADGTELVFDSPYGTFIKMILAPQNYYTGYLERIYNVEDFEAEYIDILFMNTTQCSYAEEPDFSGSDVISEAEWYGNEEEKFMTLRLYLRNKGDFGGYSYKKTDDGKISISFRKKADSLAGSVIMLDPGHGGYGSPGTNYNMTVYEEDIVYNIALKTADILESHGATVIMTRGEDEAVFLYERVALLRKKSPDVFVSIHSDGSDNANWFGTHTFYYKSFSMPLAEKIHNNLVSAYRNYYYTDPSSEEHENVDMGVKFFPYMVTRAEECPSVLVECGYLTNENDARFLMNSQGQTVLATAIAQGIVDYFGQ